jgi:hypothetical protein
MSYSAAAASSVLFWCRLASPRATLHRCWLLAAPARGEGAYASGVEGGGYTFQAAAVACLTMQAARITGAGHGTASMLGWKPRSWCSS